MTNHETDRRAQWASALWEAAEHHTVAEWICCDPIDPKHGLCVAGGKTLEMLRALIVDDPEASGPAPLTTVALELAAAVSVPPPATRADAQTTVLREAAEALGRMDYDTDSHDYGYDTYRDAWNGGVMDGADLLRRLADEATPVVVPSPPANEPGPAVAAVRALHQPMQRGPFTICAHCSGWDGKWRCLGVVTDYPCPTIRALDGEQPSGGPVAGEQQNETPEAETGGCTCGAAGDCFVPLGHYADCPRAEAPE